MAKTTASSSTTTPIPADQLAIPLDPASKMPGGDVVTILANKHKSTGAAAAFQGRNASGRAWKMRPQKRATSLIKTKTNNATKSWHERQAAKLRNDEIKTLQRELQEQRRDAKVAKRERRLDNERRRMQNEFDQASKSASALNTTTAGIKIRAMSKRQLRQIKKTRVNNKTGVVEYVPLYQK
mmetsp:Transcript_21510/g.59870  ORF Transcript_21510/g.59870 Transcript_21510/m.59870 type:complete len:182 (+) Transcript_21510:78-623(+)|eukprot:CAMPEP_0198120946 /NCGR_PEP_ID=MMETSP1442-20131203/30747_1 /TAXON_ID= /ORGANISM="Craspedostauros australis, Strain CCMP3328" /LENGTH=181 /DNA_ID=CAMNT_0043779681 /DNA_START=76 /DNA_END=621 /DNA_ORIENTATION=+